MTSIHVFKFKEVSDLFGSKAAWNILFVAEHQESCSHEFFLFEERMKFSLGIFESKFIWAVNDPDDSVGLFKIVPPIGSDGSLSSDIPNIKFIVLIGQGFDIESKGGWYLIDIFSVEFFDDGSFSGIIKA